MITAGRLRHRVRVERASIARDDFGAAVRRWRLVSRAWMSVQPIRGREILQADQAQSHITHRVLARAGLDVRHGDSLVYDGRRLHIEAVIDTHERHREIEIMAVEERGGETGESCGH